MVFGVYMYQGSFFWVLNYWMHVLQKRLVFTVITIGIYKYYLVIHKASVLECYRYLKYEDGDCFDLGMFEHS